MYQWLVVEEALHEIGFGFGLQRDVEHALCPAFCRPTLTLAQVVDSAPVGQTYHLVEIHLKPVGSHLVDARLALVEGHPGEAAPIAREVHVTVVISLDISLHGEIAGQRVGLPVAIARVHGNGHPSGRVVALHHWAHHAVAGHAPVVERLVGVLLQLVAQAPHHH